MRTSRPLLKAFGAAAVLGASLTALLFAVSLAMPPEWVRPGFQTDDIPFVLRSLAALGAAALIVGVLARRSAEVWSTWRIGIAVLAVAIPLLLLFPFVAMTLRLSPG